MGKSTQWVLIAVGAVGGFVLLFLGISHLRTLVDAGVIPDEVLTSRVNSTLWPLVIGLWLLTGSIIAAFHTRRSR